MKKRRQRTGGIFVMLLTTLCANLAPAGAQIPKTPRSPYAAPSDQSLVVFVRPRRRQASEVAYRVVTRNGRCIAVLENDSQAVAALWPGRHMLMVITGTAPPTVQLMEAKVTAGKTYVIELRPRVNVKSPVEITVVRRSDQALQAFPPAVRERLVAKPDLRTCTEWVSWKRAKIEPRAERAKLHWDEATDEHRDAHTVRRNDGWTAAETQEP